MADRITPEQRSKNMRNVHGKNTKPEIYIRKLLFSRGYRYRVHCNNIPGHPDIWMRQYNTAIFVHGCFWHRHSGCKYASMPQTRMEFWNEKFQRNQVRDSEVKEQLANTGIKCLIIWECTIKCMRKSAEFENDMLIHITDFLNGKNMYGEL